MRFDLSRKLSFAAVQAVLACMLLLCLAGMSLGATQESMAGLNEIRTINMIEASPMVEKGSMVERGSMMERGQLLDNVEMIQATPSTDRFERLNKESAAQIVQRAVVAPLWERADQSKGLRVLQHRETLAKGDVVEPAITIRGQPTEKLVAQNPSWLFMIDEMPGAHFSHPVKLVLVDATTGERQEMDTSWWPKVNDVQLFDKEALRSDPSVTTFYRKPMADIKLSTNPGLQWAPGDFKPLISCDIWAVLACGYDDISDTFDDDTNGMYNVLKSLGVPDDHIFYVSPHAGHAGVDRPTSRANVQWAIGEVASRSDTKDKVLFLYSSHGDINLVSCVPGSIDGGSITASEMDSWLDAISCKELAIIIEACHSGSFIGRYKDGTYVATENELTGEGENNRVVFTSASTDTSSWPDVDGDSDPNPADTGSESIYGYMMAFSIASADTDGNGRISFGEAYKYAWDNDATRILGWNVPQMIEAGLKKADVYHQCLKYECYSNLPSPVLKLTGSEDYTTSAGEFTRYMLSVTNWNAYPSELFQAAPDLPPCGLNAESSRTWVDIYDQGGKRLYGFCALGTSSDLQNLWFAVEKGETPPGGVYIVLKDRRCNQDYTSNKVTIAQKKKFIAPVAPKAMIQEPMMAIDEVKYNPLPPSPVSSTGQ